MKNHLATILLVTATVFAPAATLSTGSALASTCGVDAPDAWERPGGFCDQKSTTSSQSEPVRLEVPTVPPSPPQEIVVDDDFDCFGLLIMLGTGERVRVAGC